MRPPDAASALRHLLAVALLCLCCGVRALRRECRWRFDSCRRTPPPSSPDCSVVLRQWCPQTNGSANADSGDGCNDSTALLPSNATRRDDVEAARVLLSAQCNATRLDALCDPHLCRLRTRPCAWSPFRVVRRSCAGVVRSRTRRPCCHPVTGDAVECPCRVVNASCPYVSTYSSLILANNAKDCPEGGVLNRNDRSHGGLGIHDIEIGLLGVVILLFLIFCSIIGVRRHSWKLKQPVMPDSYLRRPTVHRSNSAPHLASVMRPMVFTNLGEPVPRTLLPMTCHAAPR